MIRGRVDGRRLIWVPLHIAGDRENFTTVEAVLDTGFSGTLTIPPHIVLDMGLSSDYYTDVTLGNDVPASLKTYSGFLLWHERLRAVPIFESAGAPLLGTRLLAGSRLIVQFRNGGEVVIEEIR